MKPPPIFYDPEKGNADARILHIDRFGNLVTTIPERYFDRCAIEIGPANISERIRNYAEAPQNRPCMIVGSSGLIEVVVKDGNAAEALGASLKTPLRVLKATSQGRR